MGNFLDTFVRKYIARSEEMLYEAPVISRLATPSPVLVKCGENYLLTAAPYDRVNITMDGKGYVFDLPEGTVPEIKEGSLLQVRKNSSFFLGERKAAYRVILADRDEEIDPSLIQPERQA